MLQLALSINDTCKATGFGRTKIYEAIKSGRLKARKFDARTFILKSDLEQFLESFQPFN